MDVCFTSARDVAEAIQKREMSAYEVVETYLSQIKRVNPQVNAIVSLSEEKALEEAKAADQKLISGKGVGPLHGLPIAVKDTHNATGFPTTYGSLALHNNMPSQDDLIVERLRSAGAIVVGKTNVPEFAAGAHTYNKVFGTTRNPYNLDRTAGGSSGGAAVGVACGMLPFAEGSDMGGSCRYPAAFNNVVGLRTSPGRVPTYPKQAAYSPLAVQGPIARDVKDACFLMSVIAGPDERSPISIEEPGSKFLQPLKHDLAGLRIAFSPDLGGLVPVDPSIKQAFHKQVKIFEDLGCNVEEACPDLSDADEVFQVMRAWEFELSYSDLVDRYRESMNPNFVWNVEKGRNLRGPEIGRAERLRNRLYHTMRTFFEKYDALLLPVSQAPPFDGKLEYPGEIAGVHMETYLDWMRSCYDISATGNPSLSIPGGFLEDGLPHGIQIVGPHRSDFEILSIGHVFEQATGYGKQHPNFAEVKN